MLYYIVIKKCFQDLISRDKLFSKTFYISETGLQ